MLFQLRGGPVFDRSISHIKALQMRTLTDIIAEPPSYAGQVEAHYVYAKFVDCLYRIRDVPYRFRHLVPIDCPMRVRKQAVRELGERASSLLVLGSSLAVMSSYKIALDTVRAGKPLAVINQGPGRADARATYLWRADVADALYNLARQ